MTAPYDMRKLFNIDLILGLKEKKKFLKPVTSLHIFEPSSTIFKKDGLFSLEIFGPLGSDARSKLISYVNLNIPIMHPLIYQTYIKLKGFYGEIMSGKGYAVFDNKTKDFIPLPKEQGGQTGYTFFINHMEHIKFEDRKSESRKYRIKLIEKYGKKEHMFTEWIVLPAGLRDYTVSPDGRPTEDEINSLYRKLLATSNMLLNNTITEDNQELFDPVRLRIQKTVFEIYSHIIALLDGKNKFIQNQWVKRAVKDGTRNVITSIKPMINDLDTDNKISSNHTIVGLYQFVKSIRPLTINKVLTKFSSKIFNQYTNEVNLVNPKTMKYETYEIKVENRDEWLSPSGINNIMNKLKLTNVLTSPVKIEDKYLLLVYDDSKNIKILYNNNDIEGLDSKYIRPITYSELFYIAIEDISRNTPAFITRYPVIEKGSIYPSYMYCKTTLHGREVNYQDGLIEKKLYEYPDFNYDWIKSVTPNINRLAGLGGDFDGDCVLGSTLIRWLPSKLSKLDKKSLNENLITTIKSLNNILLMRNNIKENNMITGSKRVVYNYGLVSLKNFPKSKLIKTEGNKEFYEVPDGIEVLTSWNGDFKWVKPTSFSVHKDLKMLIVRTHKGNTIECSDDASIVSVNDKLEYNRTKPYVGMTIPFIKDGLNKFVDKRKYKYVIESEGIKFNLDKDFGYLFGAIIGDGWVNRDNVKHKQGSIMLASTTPEIKDKITSTMEKYGFDRKPYSIDTPHEFRGYDCFSTKHTWHWLPVASLLRKHIGHGAENKKLPNFWRNTSESFRWGLLAGLIDTDGTVVTDINGRVAVSYTTISHDLTYGYQALCNSLGLTAGVNIHFRKSRNGRPEYVISLTNDSIVKAKDKLPLQHPEKAKKLKEMNPKLDLELMKFTPNIPLDKLYELSRHIGCPKVIKNDEDRLTKQYYSKVADAIKKAKEYEYGMGYFTVSVIKPIMEKYKSFFDNSPYWSKFREMVLDENIEWEVIRSVLPLEERMDAYDLTVPPYNTFILQNGAIVYDTVSLNSVITEESKKEIDDLLRDPSYYLEADNSFTASASNDVVDLVMKHITDDK